MKPAPRAGTAGVGVGEGWKRVAQRRDGERMQTPELLRKLPSNSTLTFCGPMNLTSFSVPFCEGSGQVAKAGLCSGNENTSMGSGKKGIVLSPHFVQTDSQEPRQQKA